MTLRYGSVCSGIEAATVAWHPLGWQPQFFSEIEKFPCAVLNHHFPSVPNFGDMTKFMEWPNVGIDLLVGGTPCQSFSLAGLRRGMVDPRGNLALVYLAILDKYRPRWCIWENVPGVLSSSGGRDFGSFLGALGQLGYSFAYRVLDAQYFGVPQRRRRVFVVGHLGDWRSAAAVLFEADTKLLEKTCQRLATYSVERQVKLARVSPTITRACPLNNGGGTWSGGFAIEETDGIRNMTNLEAERLQGFPDNWTAIPFAVDSHRYKALGNSMAVPVMRWIGEGIAAVDAHTTAPSEAL